MFTDIPEVDYLILEQMEDDDLAQYCQTSEYARELCLIPNIKKRLDIYQQYLTFNLMDIIPSYPFKSPMIICKIEKYNYPNKTILSYELYIIKENYTIIDYLAREVDGEASILLDINHPAEFDINEILGEEASFNLDINTIYDILVDKGLNKYAKSYLINHVTSTIDTIRFDDTIDQFFEVMGLFYWLKSQCMFLKIVQDTIDTLEQEFDISYIESEEGITLQNNMINAIDYYYNLLINYIEEFY